MRPRMPLGPHDHPSLQATRVHKDTEKYSHHILHCSRATHFRLRSVSLMLSFHRFSWLARMATAASLAWSVPLYWLYHVADADRRAGLRAHGGARRVFAERAAWRQDDSACGNRNRYRAVACLRCCMQAASQSTAVSALTRASAAPSCTPNGKRRDTVAAKFDGSE